MNVKTAAVVLLLWVGACSAYTQTIPALTLKQTIALPSDTGKFDHFAIDLNANRLFIAATGNHSVEALDLNAGRVTESLGGVQPGKLHVHQLDVKVVSLCRPPDSDSTVG